MATAFIAALGALRAHQGWLDVIGNNLANANTTGFKSSRAVFSELLSVTVRPATAPTSNLGGTNPLQKGIGTQLAAVDRSFEQGALNQTGRTFDLALQGQGFFSLTDGSTNFYTRVGTFGLDGSNNMVDLRTGLRVNDSTGATFQIDPNQVQAPRATSEIGFSGNLPAVVTGPVGEQLSMGTPLSAGSAAQMAGSVTGGFFIPNGETWTMELIVNNGAPKEVSIQGTGTPLTATDIATAINAQTDHVLASPGTGGEVVLASDLSGKASTIRVSPGSPGRDLKGLVGLADFVQGTESLATGATDLNDLTLNLSDYASGDLIQISATDADGSPVIASFVYGTDGTTVNDLVSFMNAQFSQSTAAFDAVSGQITLTADATGEGDLSLAISDGANQAGSAAWSQSFFSVTTDGAGPDMLTSSVEVFDVNGTSHILTFTYERQVDGTWDLSVSVPPSEGTVVQGTVSGITFNANGSILTPTSGQIELQFGALTSQIMNLDLGTSGLFEGLTQFGSDPDVIADFQDGYGSGELTNVQVLDNGIIEGFFSNGQTQQLGSFGVARFPNQSALEDLGEGLLRQTPNTGALVIGNGGQNGAAGVVGGALETSNVDTAVEFVHLIEAQRGFQANARVITVQDEILAEVVNVI